jgi:hypothetical protein
MDAVLDPSMPFSRPFLASLITFKTPLMPIWAQINHFRPHQCDYKPTDAILDPIDAIFEAILGLPHNL